ncbi:GNAT family N-acetyltransferase [Pseudoduganella lutea]|uniref:GNAT family N-acetyltransferase n=1 Tax=Pseudoduganella lutea TaxID=321985 RepID=A0A4P6KXE4_9BURK|nr:GNAT family N-acetyltransferase [Pseudoduganella lutea]QBE63670.1 GNAT family N-acetyltransferase [Pseudoduganella lutea]
MTIEKTIAHTANIGQATGADAPRLFEVWEASVRATHDFLDEEAIATLVPLVRDMVATFAPLYCLRDSSGAPYAFMGVADGKIEMLFVHPDHRGNGAGRALTAFAIGTLGARSVDVNEQNGQAVGFYARLGFRQAGRSEHDPFGHPYPILHLELP